MIVNIIYDVRELMYCNLCLFFIFAENFSSRDSLNSSHIIVVKRKAHCSGCDMNLYVTI